MNIVESLPVLDHHNPVVRRDVDHLEINIEVAAGRQAYRLTVDNQRHTGPQRLDCHTAALDRFIGQLFIVAERERLCPGQTSPRIRRGRRINSLTAQDAPNLVLVLVGQVDVLPLLAADVLIPVTECLVR